ncbi:MAG: xanthine dehydrogenase family protein subunit M [Propionibacteriales bacterium]|nr:xanthine dehydrogenase family protein subunit M [Propionibacteriales bacterium]
MKPPRFRYFAADSTAHAVELLGEYGDEAKLLAGGQSVVPLLNFRLVAPAVLIDINRITELDHVRVDGITTRVGALVRQRTIERDQELRRRGPMLTETVGLIGHVAIRNRGTVGGALAHADPAGEWPALGLLLGACFRIVGPRGRRTVPVDEFFRGFLTTAIEPDELLEEVELRLPSPGAGHAFVEVARRHGDFALVGVGAVVELDSRCRIAHIAIALIGVASTAVRAGDAERVLRGELPSTELVKSAAEAAAAGLDPVDDIHASGTYRRRIAGVLTRRALYTALARAGWERRDVA